MQTSHLHDIRTGCQDANAVNAPIRTVANLVRICIFAYSLPLCVDLVRISNLHMYLHVVQIYANGNTFAPTFTIVQIKCDFILIFSGLNLP